MQENSSIFFIQQAMKERNKIKLKHPFIGQEKYPERKFLSWVHMRPLYFTFYAKKNAPCMFFKIIGYDWIIDTCF